MKLIHNPLNTKISVAVFGFCIPIKLLICMGKVEKTTESVTFVSVASEL